MAYFIPAVAIALFAGAAVDDIAHRRIANAFVLGLSLLAVLRLVFGASFGAATGTPILDIAVAFAVFAAGAALFHFGLFGGGDVKLLAAGALWIGAASAGSYLFATALAGGLLAMGFVTWTFVANAMGGGGRRPSLPYGVAISAGGILVTAGLV
ncbi:MAG: prepilin peptidase [Rhodobacteraceae bacterium]|nr:prepilin peptidase [Paracoccaceae bacterium]